MMSQNLAESKLLDTQVIKEQVIQQLEEEKVG